MVTASHNPKGDNGLKLYGRHGCQLVGPGEKAVIEAMRSKLLPRPANPRPAAMSVASTGDLLAEYLKLLPPIGPAPGPALRIVYTPLHGVGWRYAKALFPPGTVELLAVPEQRDPHGDFPTVTYPNPEDGDSPVLHLAMDLASKHSVALVAANDPDADRFALAEYQRDKAEWRVFTGNEVAVIFAVFLMDQLGDKETDEEVYFLTTAVSSQWLDRRLAAKHANVRVEATLTGFKHMGNRALDLLQRGKRVLMAYEESIGYMLGSTGVLEKDGLSALQLCGQIALRLRGEQRTFSHYLDECYRR